MILSFPVPPGKTWPTFWGWCDAASACHTFNRVWKKKKKNRTKSFLKLWCLLSVMLMVHPSLSLITHDGKSGEDGSLYNQDGLWLNEGWLFAALLSNRLRMSFFFFFFNVGLGWRTASLRLVYFLFNTGPATAQSADKHRLNSRNQSRLGTRYRAHWQLSPRWGSSVTTCAIVAPNRPPVICRAAFLFRAAEILGRTLSFPCR